MSTARKSWLKTVLKIAFVLGLLLFLTKKGFISAHETGRAFMNWQDSLPGILAMLVSGLLGAIRWQLLLRAQGTRLSMGRTTQLTLIGNFFNIALPGAVSGDFVKAFYIGKELEGQRARTFGSILFDRVAGLSALVLISAGALVLGYSEFEHSALIAGTRVFIVTGAACVLFFYCYLFLVREHHDPVLKNPARDLGAVPKDCDSDRDLRGPAPLSQSPTRRPSSVGDLDRHPAPGGMGCWHFAAALGVPGLALLALYVIVPLGMLVTAVPVAPAGVGTGHAAFLFLFGLLGCERGADIFTLFAMGNILIGMIGGVIYLRFRSHEPAPALDPAGA